MVRPENLQNRNLSGLRGMAAAFVERKSFSNFIIFLILVNAVTLGLETSSAIMADYGALLHFIDHVVLGFFIAEMLVKLFAYRLSFFRSGWNLFDFVIVAISLLPASGALAILRSLRILRVLRLMSVVPQMRRVINALLHAIPGMSSIIAVLLIIFYVSSVLSTKIFGGVADDPVMQDLFGTIPRSMFTMFQLMTLEGWRGDVAEPTLAHFPWAWAFFIPFIMIASFAVLNLFIGVIVDAMALIQAQETREERLEIKEAAHEDALALSAEIKGLREKIDEIERLLRARV